MRHGNNQGDRLHDAGPVAAQRGNPQGYIISTDCMDCGVCEFMCPRGAIFEAKRQFVIRKGLCDGCGECVPYCPARAIVARMAFGSRQDRTVRKLLGAVLDPAN
jgi:MinD superfamily P-loop ATPase